MSDNPKKPLQIYLRQDQLLALRRVAERRGESLASLVRDSVDQFLGSLPVDQDPLLEIIGLYDSGLEDLAENHDQHLSRLLNEEARSES